MTRIQHNDDSSFGELGGDGQHESLEGRGGGQHCTTCTCGKNTSQHCTTCTCAERQPLSDRSTSGSTRLARCGAAIRDDDAQPLPPPLPEPVYSIRRRLLSPSNVALNSAAGKHRLVRALSSGTAASYVQISQHAVNQSEPAYCGVTTAVILLNALEIDVPFRWKGGWRYWADESVLLSQCPCVSANVVQRVGITADQFQRLMQCQGLDSTFKRPDGTAYTVERFRRDAIGILTESESTEGSNIASTANMPGVLVTSFSRSALGQTGDGHFSPVTAYHKETDSVLVQDVARYKYPPYWVSVSDLFGAMAPVDKATGKARGWFLIHRKTSTSQAAAVRSENRRPAHLVPLAGEVHPCPVHPVTVEFCPNNTDR